MGDPRFDGPSIRAAHVVLPAGDLDLTLAFFVERLGFDLELIAPADRPSRAVIAGHGIRVALEPETTAPPGTLRLLCDDLAAVADERRALLAPNGVIVELVPVDSPPVVPAAEQSFVLTTIANGGAPSVGRAGMRYRDLIPGRLGGRFIASHISIHEGGPVPDYVHFHNVRVQLIYCVKGWVRVVYEDQGPPFVLRAGDCVLQPPRIRHRVLESSPGLEVVEITCPAHHDTIVDGMLELPTAAVRPEREFGGQQFVRHDASVATWEPWRRPGFESRDTGIGVATRGLAGARVVRPCGPTDDGPWSHDGELCFAFVLGGEMTLDVDGAGGHDVRAGDAFAIPPRTYHRFRRCSEALELLEVTLPAELPTRPP